MMQESRFSVPDTFVSLEHSLRPETLNASGSRRACQMAISRNASSLPDFPEFAQAVRYSVPGTPAVASTLQCLSFSLPLSAVAGSHGPTAAARGGVWFHCALTDALPTAAPRQSRLGQGKPTPSSRNPGGQARGRSALMQPRRRKTNPVRPTRCIHSRGDEIIIWGPVLPGWPGMAARPLIPLFTENLSSSKCPV